MREMTNNDLKESIINNNKDLNPDFIFIAPAHNFRSTELNAVIGLSQLKKLDSNNDCRISNFKYFMEKLDSNKYHTDINMEGQCNYAFIVVLKTNNFDVRDNVEKTLRENGIEFRRGLSGGGNQLRQPYFKQNYNIDYDNFKNMEHVHNFGWYIGNYPTLEKEKIDKLLNVLNNI
jgi:CDP-6-deoxy-D-xylo-4-hexulose-3-dehydrase